MTDVVVIPSTSRTTSVRNRVGHVDPVLAIVAAICALLIAIAIFGPYLAPQDPSATDILNQNAQPSSAHWLGTDGLGRDVLSRLLTGARLSLLGAAMVVILAAAAGTAIAIVSAWHGGLFDRIATRVMNILFAFPGLLIAVIAVAAFGAGLAAPVIALAIAYTPYIGRVARIIAIQQRNMPYVDACQMAGFASWRICAKHILPNIWPVVQAQATVAFGFALLDLAGLSFIGLGVQPPSAEWGLMIADSRSDVINGHLGATLAASVMIILTVVAFNVLGERLAARAREMQ